MAIDFKNIQFKYVKITGGSSTIDVTMDDTKFKANKPDGYYRCFIFPNMKFSGVDYSDLKNLVSIEEQNIWDKINRDTFLGYNQQTNKFICNITAYMGLKDSDLKTDGSMPHSGQVGWYEMNLSTTQSNSIITLKQIDGTDSYLSIKDPTGPYIDYLGSNMTGSICIENNKKRVVGSTVIKKNGCLWCKSPEDNSALMVMNNAPPSAIIDLVFNYVNSGRLCHITSRSNNIYTQAFMFGKPVIYFPSHTSQDRVSTNAFSPGVTDMSVKNFTGNTKDHIEFVETSNLNDILNSNEYVIFYPVINRGYYHSALLGSRKLEDTRFYHYAPTITDVGSSETSSFTSYSTPKVKGIKFDLISLNFKDKQFYYNSNNLDFVFDGFKKGKLTMTSNSINLEDGFILCLIAVINNDYFIIRIKNGDPVKKKSVAAATRYVNITGSTGFEFNAYSSIADLKKTDISKDDLVNSTGFVDLQAGESYETISTNYFPVITILKV